MVMGGASYEKMQRQNLLTMITLPSAVTTETFSTWPRKSKYL